MPHAPSSAAVSAPATATGPENDNDDAASESAAVSLLNAAEHYVVGLSPNYWAHVPLLVHQIHHQLKLIDGVTCLIVEAPGSDDDALRSTAELGAVAGAATAATAAKQLGTKFVPVTKCDVVGMVVAVERRSNGCLVYVIDDGTGLIDCISWNGGGCVGGGENCAQEDDFNPNSLPPLVPLVNGGGDGGGSALPVAVGEMARVMGRIESICLSPAKDGSNIIGYSEIGNVAFHDCIREIHASSVTKFSSSTLDVESRHWKRCFDFTSRAPANTNKRMRSLCNAKDVLEYQVGREICSQVLQKQNMPVSLDDDAGMWRLFGSNCQCDKKVSYKDALLYCHCHATTEPLDPFFRYRDCLLETLIQMENDVPSIQGDREEELWQRQCLRFQYISVVRKLKETAASVVIALRPVPSDNAALASAANEQRLAINTFRALRQDGIVYLLDEASDTYILISRRRVLEPYIRSTIPSSTGVSSTEDSNGSDAMSSSERAFNCRHFKGRPRYLSKVPKVRLDIVKRLLGKTVSSQQQQKP